MTVEGDRRSQSTTIAASWSPIEELLGLALLVSALGRCLAGLNESSWGTRGWNIPGGLIFFEYEKGWISSSIETAEKSLFGFPVLRVDADIENAFQKLLHFLLT